jgi:hypothetical protein
MKALLGETVFSVGEVDYRWGDVVEAAELWGDWARLRERAREGAAALERSDGWEDAISEEEVESAAEEFRYARDLISAEEMEDWLQRWGLTAEEWMDWVRVSLLRRKSSDSLGPVLQDEPDEESLERFLLAEAVCSGELEQLAYKLAGRAAVTQKELASSAPLALREESFRACCERALTAAAAAREIRLHRREWTRLDCRRLDFRREEEAREASLCAREDGSPIENVAASSGAPIFPESMVLGKLDADLQEKFLAARKGDWVGPVRRGEGYALYLVVEKTRPSESDPGDVRLAEEAILRRLLDREINDRVKWRVPLGVGS